MSFKSLAYLIVRWGSVFCRVVSVVFESVDILEYYRDDENKALL